MGKKWLFAAFIIVILSTGVFAAMGYHYLTYRNMLMQNAVLRSEQMSVRMFAEHLEQEIISREKRMILDIAFEHQNRIALQQLSRIKESYPLIDLIFIHEGFDPTDRDESLQQWLLQQVKDNLTESTVDMLTLRHFSGSFNNRPIQAGFIQLPPSSSDSVPEFLIFTLDLDFIRNHLLVQQKQRAQKYLLNYFIRDDTGSADKDMIAEKFLVNHSFHDILPFWSVSTKIDNLGIRDRSRIEFIIYSYLISFLVLLIILSIYFIWRQLQYEQKLSQVKSQMIFHVSHELKTPLALIRMYTETLMLGRVTGQAKVQDYYRTILAECDHLSLLINNTLDFSSVEKGIREYHFSHGNLANTIRNVMTQYSYYLEQNGFSFRIDIDDNIPELKFDKLAMNQVIGNLLDNAIKFSPNEKNIHLWLFKKPGELQLKITDNGIGIDSESLETIFQPYKRLSSHFRGSGIGLSLVQHAVEAHGGSIYAISKEGLGSTFIVNLPLPEGKNVAYD
jgi:signal transduction histidine kinase